MRLLFLVSRHETDPRAAGGDIMGSAYARYLADAGHEISYLTSSYKGAPREERRDGVRIVRLGRPELLAWRMYRYYRRWGDRFDLVYEEAIGGARIPFCAPLYVKQPILTAWYQVNRPIFFHQYGRWLGEGLSLLEKWLARVHRNAKIIAVSEARRQDLLGLGFRPEQIVTVPPIAVEESFFERPAGASREPLIVWLGKLRRYKCVHHAVEAMREVVKECPDARLVVAGRRDDEGYLRELRQQINRLDLKGAVRFAFDLSEEEKRDLLGRASALVLPSPVEGFGIVVLEAGAQGTPVVASEGVPDDVVVDGYNGIRVPFADTDRLAAAMSLLLRSPDNHATLSANALEHAHTYSREKLLRRLEAVLESAAPSRVLQRQGV